MKVICGLGNPGRQYENTRHNAGFIFLDLLRQHYDFPEFQEKWDGLYSEKGLGDHKWVLFKPMKYMNLSGWPLKQVVDFYKVPLTDLVVVYDDVDLPLGTDRYRVSGSAGTHNGMKSVIEVFGTEEIPRLRLGIESRGELIPEKVNLHDFVLGQFTSEEGARFKEAMVKAMATLENALA